MAAIQPRIPNVWLLTDERNDKALETVLGFLPDTRHGGSALVFRHYHLPPVERYARFLALARIARAVGHLVILADSALKAREWGADGIYGAPLSLTPRRCDLLHIATAHNLREIAQANRIGADAVMLSPVFPTRSHPGAKTLGAQRFLHLARRSKAPVIALGGMDQNNAIRLRWQCWAGIDAFG